MLFLIIWVNWVNSALSSMSCVWSFITPSPRVKRQRQTKPFWAKTCYGTKSNSHQPEHTQAGHYKNASHHPRKTQMLLGQIHEIQKLLRTKNDGRWKKKTMVAEKKNPNPPTTNNTPSQNPEKSKLKLRKNSKPQPAKTQNSQKKKTTWGGVWQYPRAASTVTGPPGQNKVNLLRFNMQLGLLSSRRDISMLGLLHRIILKDAPVQFSKYIYRASESSARRGWAFTAIRHTHQLHDILSSPSAKIVERSVFRLVHPYNVLPQFVVDSISKNNFQINRLSAHVL